MSCKAKVPGCPQKPGGLPALTGLAVLRWCCLAVQVKYMEGELAEEALQLAIVNDDNSLLMLTATLPLAALLPRVHYNLKV